MDKQSFRYRSQDSPCIFHVQHLAQYSCKTAASDDRIRCLQSVYFRRQCDSDCHLLAILRVTTFMTPRLGEPDDKHNVNGQHDGATAHISKDLNGHVSLSSDVIAR